MGTINSGVYDARGGAGESTLQAEGQGVPTFGRQQSGFQSNSIMIHSKQIMSNVNKSTVFGKLRVPSLRVY